MMQKQLVKLLFCTVLITGCKDKNKIEDVVTTPPLVFEKEGEVVLIREPRDTIAQLDVEIADNDYERETGLMYRRSMAADRGMLFVYDQERPRGFYMKNTSIPLDLIFLNSDRKILSIFPNAEPNNLQTIPSKKPAQYVLEVNAGLAKEWGLQIGDKLILERE